MNRLKWICWFAVALACAMTLACVAIAFAIT